MARKPTATGERPCRLLFLCADNSFCSPMARAFAAARKMPGVEILSAGLQAGRVHPLAVRLMAELGTDLPAGDGLVLQRLTATELDVVVSLCCESSEQCPVLPGNPVRVDWSLQVPDLGRPEDAALLDAARAVRDQIRRLVDDFFDRGYLAALTEAKRAAGLILDNISDGIIAHDLNRNVFYFNRAAVELTGYRREEVLALLKK